MITVPALPLNNLPSSEEKNLLRFGAAVRFKEKHKAWTPRSPFDAEGGIENYQSDSTPSSSYYDPFSWLKEYNLLTRNVLQQDEFTALHRNYQAFVIKGKVKVGCCVQTMPSLSTLKAAIGKERSSSYFDFPVGNPRHDSSKGDVTRVKSIIEVPSPTLWLVRASQEGEIFIFDALSGAPLLSLHSCKYNVGITSITHAPFRGLLNRETQVITIEKPVDLLSVKESEVLPSDYVWVGFADGSIRLFPGHHERMLKDTCSKSDAQSFTDVVFEVPKYHAGPIVSIITSPSVEEGDVELSARTRLSTIMKNVNSARYNAKAGAPAAREHLSLVCSASVDSVVVVWDVRKIYQKLQEAVEVERKDRRNSLFKETKSSACAQDYIRVENLGGVAMGSHQTTSGTLKCILVKVRPLLRLKGGVAGLTCLRWVSTLVTTVGYRPERQPDMVTRDPLENSAPETVKGRRELQELTRFDQREMQRRLLGLSEKEMVEVEDELRFLLPPLTLEKPQSVRVNLLFAGDSVGTVHVWNLDEELSRESDYKDPNAHFVELHDPTKSPTQIASGNRRRVRTHVQMSVVQPPSRSFQSKADDVPSGYVTVTAPEPQRSAATARSGVLGRHPRTPRAANASQSSPLERLAMERMGIVDKNSRADASPVVVKTSKRRTKAELGKVSSLRKFKEPPFAVPSPRVAKPSVSKKVPLLRFRSHSPLIFNEIQSPQVPVRERSVSFAPSASRHKLKVKTARTPCLRRSADRPSAKGIGLSSRAQTGRSKLTGRVAQGAGKECGADEVKRKEKQSVSLMSDQLTRLAKCRIEFTGGMAVVGMAIQLPRQITVSMRRLVDPIEKEQSLLEDPIPEEVEQRFLENSFTDLDEAKALFFLFQQLQLHISVEGAVLSFRFDPKWIAPDEDGRKLFMKRDFSDMAKKIRNTEEVLLDCYLRLPSFNVHMHKLVLDAHSQPVCSLFLEPKRKLIWTGRADGLLSLFSTESKYIITQVAHPSASRAQGPPDAVQWTKELKRFLNNSNFMTFSRKLQKHKETLDYDLARFTGFIPLARRRQQCFGIVCRRRYSGEVSVNECSPNSDPGSGSYSPSKGSTIVHYLDGRDALSPLDRKHERHLNVFVDYLKLCRQNANSVRKAQRKFSLSMEEKCKREQELCESVRQGVFSELILLRNAFKAWKEHHKYYTIERCARRLAMERQRIKNLSAEALERNNCRDRRLSCFYMWQKFSTLKKIHFYYRSIAQMMRESKKRLSRPSPHMMRYLATTTSQRRTFRLWKEWILSKRESQAVDPLLSARLPSSSRLPSIIMISENRSPHMKSSLSSSISLDSASDRFLKVISAIYAAKRYLLSFKDGFSSEILEEAWLPVLEVSEESSQSDDMDDKKVAVFKYGLLPVLEGFVTSNADANLNMDDPDVKEEVISMMHGVLMFLDYLIAIPEETYVELIGAGKVPYREYESMKITHNSRLDSLLFSSESALRGIVYYYMSFLSHDGDCVGIIGAISSNFQLFKTSLSLIQLDDRYA